MPQPNRTRKLSPDDARLIRELLANHCRPVDIAWFFEVSRHNIYLISRNKIHTGQPKLPRNDRKFSDDDVRYMRKLHAEGRSSIQIISQLRETRGVRLNSGTLYQITSRKTYQDVV